MIILIGVAIVAALLGCILASFIRAETDRLEKDSKVMRLQPRWLYILPSPSRD